MNQIVIQENSSKEIILDNDIDNEIIVNKDSEVKIIDISKGNVTIKVGENSKAVYIAIKTSPETSSKKAIVEKYGQIHWVECYIGDKINNSIRTELNGEGSETTTFGVLFGDKENEINVKNEVIHAGNYSISNMLTRVVLNDKAKANYNGLVKINPGTKGCQGYQKKETILLSKDARIMAVPNLEIENNEVKCSHGATISQIDEEQLFYMTSRGIDEKTAKKTIIEGFFNPIIEKISNESIKSSVIESINQRLGDIKWIS